MTTSTRLMGRLCGLLCVLVASSAQAGESQPIAVAGVYDPAWEVSDGASPLGRFCAAQTEAMKGILGARASCRCARAAKIETATTRADGYGQVALLQVMCDSDKGVKNDVSLVIETKRGWVQGPVVLATGTSEAHDAVGHGKVVGFSVKATAQGQVVIVDTQAVEVAVDFAANLRTSHERRDRWACRTPGTEPACFKLPVAGLTAVELIDEDAKKPKKGVALGTTTWERDVEVDVHGSVTVSAVRGTAPATLDKLKGPYAISALHRKGDVLSMWKP